MAEQDSDPADNIDLDPPVENEQDDVEQQDQQADEQDTEPEGEEVDAQPAEQDRSQAGEQRSTPSRRDRRIAALTTSLAEERRQREETGRRLDALLAGQTRTQQQGESPEARTNRRALLTAEERISEDLALARQEHARDMQGVRFAVQDGNDRAAFEAKATVDPLFAKWRPKVEAELQILRQQNMNVDREKLMYYLIGKNAVESRNATKGPQRRAAQERVDRQRTRPSNSGSDVSANRRGSQGNSLERRLENQSL